MQSCLPFRRSHGRAAIREGRRDIDRLRRAHDVIPRIMISVSIRIPVAVVRIVWIVRIVRIIRSVIMTSESRVIFVPVTIVTFLVSVTTLVLVIIIIGAVLICSSIGFVIPVLGTSKTGIWQ